MAKDVTLLTGFLGAGKTTLLNTLMAARPQTRFALIENEYGEAGIDGQLVLRPDVDTIELSDGCICCSLNDSLLDVLEDLHDRRESFDELIIETTGIADPANVAVPFLMLPMVQREFSLRRVICLVDAELIDDQLRDTEEAIQQISFSDVLLINKTDRVSADYLTYLINTLRELNPFAQVLTGQKEHYPIDELMAIVRDTAFASQPASFIPTRAKPLLATPNLPTSYTGRQGQFGTLPQHHHHRHSDIVSLSFRFDESLDLTQLYHRLTTLLLFQGKDIYRIKGIIYDASRPQRWIIQSVGKNLTMIDGVSWEVDEHPESRIVFIGKLLKPEGFEKMLRQCFTKDASWQITNSDISGKQSITGP